jgi:hypothetical protein
LPYLKNKSRFGNSILACLFSGIFFKI